MVAAAALIAASAALFVLSRDSEVVASGHAHASVRALPGASYLAISSAPDEIVVLNDGAFDVTVAPLHPDERFRVIVGGDEVEVHGTEFVATARAGVLIDVRVVHGVVEVRALVTTGSVPTPTPSASPARRNPRVPEKQVGREEHRAGLSAPVVVQRAADALPHEVAYNEGWTAMREGRFADAAQAFLRARSRFTRDRRVP